MAIQNEAVLGDDEAIFVFCDRGEWVTLLAVVKDVELPETDTELKRHETSSVDVWAILVAGGRGKRMVGGVPKQFRRLAGEPMYMFPAQSLLASGVQGLVLVVPQGTEDSVRRDTSILGERLVVTRGGRERRDSVASGLRSVPESANIVVVHDAARPFLPVSLTLKVIAAAITHGAALAARRVPDTVKRSDDGEKVRSTENRDGLYLAQTPQAFRREILDRIVTMKVSGKELTDECMGAEKLGIRPRIVPGNALLFKVTTAEDFLMAKAIAVALEKRKADDEDWFWIRRTSPD